MDARVSTDERHLSRQISILKLLAGDAEPTDILAEIIYLAETALPGAIAGVTIVDRAAQALEMAVFPSVDPIFADSIAGVPLGPPHVGTCAQALYRGEVVTSADLRKDTRWSPEWLGLCEANGIRSCRSHPLLSDNGVPLGTFMLCFPTEHDADRDDEAVIELCADLTALVLKKRRMAEHHSVVMGEINHRTRNLFSVIQTLARASFINSPGEDTYREIFEPRLLALTTAHSVIFSNDGMDLGSLLLELLQPYSDGGAIELVGPKLEMSAEATLALSIAIHELATNATKYGALSDGAGRVQLIWSTGAVSGAERFFELRWVELNGPAVAPPQREGFGTRAIKQLVSRELEGEVTLSYEPAGLSCIIRAPYSRISKVG
jgi:two-component sensor histidine kinase